MANNEQFDTIGGYKRVALIGRGGMGEVWLAVDPSTMKPCALKLLLPEFADSEEYRTLFYSEVAIASQLGGKGFVGVRSFGEHKGLLYLAMDLVDGVNLQRLLRVLRKQQNLLAVPLVIHIMRALLRSLRAAHGLRIARRDAGVVHGDIKPANILAASDGTMWLTDLGIARFAPELVITSRPMGTLRYMAPEQYYGRVCPQNDLYSAGVTMHELLTCEPMISKKGSPDEVRKRAREAPTPELSRPVPACVDDLRRQLLEKDVEKRIQSASEALELIKSIDKEIDVGDRQDEMEALYLEKIGPPRSGLTIFLQNIGDFEDEDIGSFLPGYVRRVAEAGPRAPSEPAAPTLWPQTPVAAPEVVPEGSVQQGEAPDAVPLPLAHEASAPWMLEEEAAEATQKLGGNTPDTRTQEKTAPLAGASHGFAPPPAPAPASTARQAVRPLGPPATAADNPPASHQAALARQDAPGPLAQSSPLTTHPRSPSRPTIEPTFTETAPTQRERRTLRRLAIFSAAVGAATLGLAAFLMWPPYDPPATTETNATAHLPHGDTVVPQAQPPPPPLEIRPQTEPPGPISQPKAPSPSPPIAAPNPDAEPLPEPRTRPEPSPPADKTMQPTAATQPAPTAEPKALEPRNKRTPATRKQSASPRVKVYFFPDTTDATHIRVGRRTFVVDWIATAKLRPGNYPVSWRKGEDGWHRAGRIAIGSLPANHHYEVRLGGKSPRVTPKRPR